MRGGLVGAALDAAAWMPAAGLDTDPVVLVVPSGEVLRPADVRMVLVGLESQGRILPSPLHLMLGEGPHAGAGGLWLVVEAPTPATVAALQPVLDELGGGAVVVHRAPACASALPGSAWTAGLSLHGPPGGWVRRAREAAAPGGAPTRWALLPAGAPPWAVEALRGAGVRHLVGSLPGRGGTPWRQVTWTADVGWADVCGRARGDAAALRRWALARGVSALRGGLRARVAR
jgi:hypothetical protein